MKRVCPLCGGNHRPENGSPCVADDSACWKRLDDPFAGRHAVCILEYGHRGRNHWGPDRNGRYIEWPVAHEVVIKAAR